jgi:hypothetical protein
LVVLVWDCGVGCRVMSIACLLYVHRVAVLLIAMVMAMVMVMAKAILMVVLMAVDSNRAGAD